MADQFPDDFSDLLSLTQDDVANEVPDEPTPESADDFGDMFGDLPDVQEPDPEPTAPEPAPEPAPKRTRAPRKPKAEAPVVTQEQVVAAAQSAEDPRDAEIARLKAQLATQAAQAAAVDPRDAQIAALKAQLAQSAPAPAIDPLEDEAKTEEFKTVQDQVARRNNERLESAVDEYVRADDANAAKVLIHFESDGFMAFGQTWYRGQEIEFIIPGPVYERTKDRFGNSWVDLAGDDYEQIARWGRVFFKPGPFKPRPGEEFTDDLVAEDAKRKRAVPIMPISI